MESAKPLIQFENFSFQYRAQKKPTLHDINLSIYPGEKVLIVGPSGSGKSTLAHLINGLIPFNYRGEMKGRLFVAGLETKKAGIFALSKIVGTVLQDADGQFVGLTAGEDIAFSLENNCVPQGEMFLRVQGAADSVAIGGHLDHSPYDLSGGQKQRVCMAGVLVDRVQVLLLDEPLANLDPATGKQAIELIDDIMARERTTVIIIEHRLEDVLHRKVDRIVLMDDGRIVADLPPEGMLLSGMLKNCGIREPLYLSALKYAGVDVKPGMGSADVDTLKLTENHRQALQKWALDVQDCEKVLKSSALLSVEDLSFSYGQGKPVLKNIRFSIREGEMVAIVGANGAGKSTLAKLICGFETPTKGRILLSGRDLSGESIAERASHIGYVMQNPNQMISKTMIYEEVALGLKSRGMDEKTLRARVEETLKICGLYPFRNWPISALSFGQKKRVTIACVLVMEPKIIILDEPTAGQDFRHYSDIMEFLVSLNRRGITVLMITHDMHLMLEYAPRALVFAEGEIIADISAAEALTDPALVKRASLKETSLYNLAKVAGLKNPAALAERFIDFERGEKARG